MQDIMTEKEAKTRWCPMIRAGEATKESVISINRLFDGSSPKGSHCIASDCMAWRLAHKDAADGTERGYCGAFGTPRFT